MMSQPMDQIIDLTRYPIDQLDVERGQELVATCREALENRALCALPGFVFPVVVEKMVDEASVLLPLAVRYDKPRTAYDDDGKTWPEDHPRRVAHPCRYHQALNYQIPNDSLIRQLYLWEPLSEFLRQALCYDRIYRSACPHLALTVQLSGNSDTNGWHFDGTDAVFPLLLQAPLAGGQFEYAPYVRSETGQNYEGVKRVFEQPENFALRPAIAPGAFALFKGDLSLHRVTRVEGDRRRIIALFSYDRKPGTVFPQSYIDELHRQLPRL